MMSTPAHLQAMVHNQRERFNWYEVKHAPQAPEEVTEAQTEVLEDDALQATASDVMGNPFRTGIIIKIFTENSPFTHKELMSGRRFQKLVKERQILMWILKKSLDVSYPRIGTLIGNRDHSTVINAMRKVYANEDMMDRALDVMAVIWKDRRMKFEQEVSA